MVNPELLQSLRNLLVSAKGDCAARLHRVDAQPLELDDHLRWLLFAGELRADIWLTEDGLEIEPRGLTPFGVLRLCDDGPGGRPS